MEQQKAVRPYFRRLHLRVILAVTAATAAILALTSWATWLLERDAAGSNLRTYPDSLWWAMETITTVGYGDHHPVTTGGRFVAGVLMVTGLALVGVITAAVVGWFFLEVDVIREMREIEAAAQAEEVTLEQVLRKLEAIEAELARRGPDPTG